MTFPRAMASRYASGSRISRGARRFLLLWLFLLSTRRPLHAEACVPNRLHGHSAHASNLAIRQIEPVEDLHLAHEASLGLLRHAQVREHDPRGLCILGCVAHFDFLRPFPGLFFALTLRVATAAGVESQILAISALP